TQPFRAGHDAQPLAAVKVLGVARLVPAREDTHMNVDELNTHIAKELDSLNSEFGQMVPPAVINKLCEDQCERLRREATIYDFIPLLVYRHTREQLLAGTRDELHRSA